MPQQLYWLVAMSLPIIGLAVWLEFRTRRKRKQSAEQLDAMSPMDELL